MKLIAYYKQWRMRLLIARLNSQVAYFGIAPMNEQQWIDGLKRIKPVVKISGITMQELTTALNNFKNLLNAQK